MNRRRMLSHMKLLYSWFIRPSTIMDTKKQQEAIRVELSLEIVIFSLCSGRRLKVGAFSVTDKALTQSLRLLTQ